MVRGETYDKQLFESEAFRHFINIFLNKQSGVTKGCELSKNSQSIVIGTGSFVIQGGFLKEVTGTENEIPSEAGYYKLVYEIDLSKTNTKNEFKQGNYKFVKALGDYPQLTQEDLDDGGNIYQLPFCQFRITELGLQDFKDLRKFIEYGIYQKKGKVLYENEVGTTGDIVLNDNLSNYKYIKIFWKVGNNNKSEEVLVTLDKNINLSLIDFADSKIWIHTKTMTMEDTKLTVKRYKEYSITDSEQWKPYGSSTNSIVIFKVEGYTDGE